MPSSFVLVEERASERRRLHRTAATLIVLGCLENDGEPGDSHGQSYVAFAVSSLAVLGCATQPTPPPASPTDWKVASFSRSSGNDLRGIQIDDRNITGPNTKLYVGWGAIRGTLKFGVPVQVTVQGDKAEGTVGSAPFNCVVDSNSDGSAHVTAGTVGGRNMEFTISPQRISGRISDVTYNMTWTGERYENRRDSGGFAVLALPLQCRHGRIPKSHAC